MRCGTESVTIGDNSASTMYPQKLRSGNGFKHCEMQRRNAV